MLPSCDLLTRQRRWSKTWCYEDWNNRVCGGVYGYGLVRVPVKGERGVTVWGKGVWSWWFQRGCCENYTIALGRGQSNSNPSRLQLARPFYIKTRWYILEKTQPLLANGISTKSPVGTLKYYACVLIQLTNSKRSSQMPTAGSRVAGILIQLNDRLQEVWISPANGSRLHMHVCTKSCTCTCHWITCPCQSLKSCMFVLNFLSFLLLMGTTCNCFSLKESYHMYVCHQCLKSQAKISVSPMHTLVWFFFL